MARAQVSAKRCLAELLYLTSCLTSCLSRLLFPKSWVCVLCNGLENKHVNKHVACKLLLYFLLCKALWIDTIVYSNGIVAFRFAVSPVFLMLHGGSVSKREACFRTLMNSVWAAVAVAVQSRSACVGPEPTGWEGGGGVWLQPSRELPMVKVTAVHSSGYKWLVRQHCPVRSSSKILTLIKQRWETL